MKTKTPWYNKIEMAIIVVLFSCMTLITLTRVMFVWITFAGISLAGLRGAHMRVSAITLLIGEKRGKYVFWFGDLVSIAFGLFIAYKMSMVTRNTIANHQVFTSMTWMPVWMMYISGVLGMLGFAIRTAQRMIGEICANKKQKAEEGGKR